MAKHIPTPSTAPSKPEQRHPEDDRATWERPALRRLSANDAEAGAATMGDGPGGGKS